MSRRDKRQEACCNRIEMRPFMGAQKGKIMSRRVVVTGMGAITPIGLSVDEFWNGVKAVSYTHLTLPTILLV